MIVVFRELCP